MICSSCSMSQHEKCTSPASCPCQHKGPEKKDEEITQEAGSD